MLFTRPYIAELNNKLNGKKNEQVNNNMKIIKLRNLPMELLCHEIL